MKILIQCGDHLENQHRIVTLAAELKSAGHTPIVLLYSKHKGRYFENKGIKTVSLNEHFPLEPVPAGVTIDTFLEEGVKYSDVMRAEAMRQPMISWPGKRNGTLRNIFRNYSSLKKIISIHSPDKIVIWNGFTGYVANILRLLCTARNIESAFLERGLVKGSLFIDRQGVNGASSLSSLTPSLLDSLDVSEADIAYVSEVFSLVRRSESLAQPAASNKVFFPLQVQMDTNIIMYSKYRSMREAFFDIYNALNKGESTFLLRPHPEESADVFPNIPRFENTEVTTSESLNHWIDWSDVVVTINSTVGLEALLKGKQVITLGDSIYSSSGLTSALGKPLLPASVEHETRLVNYLVYLIKSNVLVPNSPYNKFVIATQLTSGGAEYRQPELAPVTVSTEAVDIHIDFPLNVTLDLTYRKNKAAITKGWLLDIVKNNVDAVAYEFSSASRPRRDRFSVKIVAESKRSKHDSEFNKTIDIYGNEIR